MLRSIERSVVMNRAKKDYARQTGKYGSRKSFREEWAFYKWQKAQRRAKYEAAD